MVISGENMNEIPTLKIFLGEYTPSFTSGSRIALPKKIREKISGNNLIFTKGLERCLLGYDPSDWNAEARKHLEAPISDSKTRHLKQYFFSGAVDTEIDDQGRVVIPPILLDYASLKKEVVVIGAGDHFEIWDQTSWKKHLSRVSEEISE